jgi:hypothetical protein
MMKRNLIFICFIGLLSCSNKSAKNNAAPGSLTLPGKGSAYVWTKLLDSAGWKKSYNFQMFSLRDTLWVFHPDGNWYSADGTRWRKSALPNAIGNLGFLDYVPFKGAIYGLGHFEGNIEHFTLKTAIYRSTDFKHWETLAAASNLPHRFFYHPFVFAGKIWISGGQDAQHTYADMWNSADGVHWVKVKDNLPYSKRIHSQVLQFNGRLYLLNNDVWSSADGLNWQQVTPYILKGQEIFGYAPVVFDGKIWLLGCNRNGRFSSQVLYSTDGKSWHTQAAPWSPRGAMAAAVYRQKIYITGGKYGGTPDAPDFRYSNDVWAMSKQ